MCGSHKSNMFLGISRATHPTCASPVSQIKLQIWWSRNGAIWGRGDGAKHVRFFICNSQTCILAYNVIPPDLPGKRESTKLSDVECGCIYLHMADTRWCYLLFPSHWNQCVCSLFTASECLAPDNVVSFVTPRFQCWYNLSLFSFRIPNKSSSESLVYALITRF